MKPKEDPKDKAARLRERRISELERTKSAQDQAEGLTSDLRAVYGMKGIPNTVGTYSDQAASPNMFNFKPKGSSR